MSDRSLHDIAAEMAELVEASGDPEAAHSRGDDLLIEALQWLAAGESRHVENHVRNIVGNWRQIDKWYA